MTVTHGRGRCEPKCHVTFNENKISPQKTLIKLFVKFKMSYHTGGITKYHMEDGGGLKLAKNRHVLFEWPLTGADAINISGLLGSLRV